MSEMDAAYANAVHIPDGRSFPTKWARAAAAFRAGAVAELDLPYGPGPRAVFDLFHPPGAAIGTLVFVHGGYWLDFDKSFWSHLAAGPLAHGFRVAIPSYDLCPAVRIGQITQQIAQAVDHIATMSGGPLILTGHSAGGHLVARLGCADVELACRDRIAGTVPISPLSDLRPLMETAMNADLRLNADEAASESPLLHPAPDVPVHVIVGAAERPVFLDQARWLATAWGAPMTLCTDLHHFNVVEELAKSDSDLVRIVTALV